MAEETTQERNQPASARREREFRERGDRGLSHELITVVVLGTSALVVGLAPTLSGGARSFFIGTLSNLDGPPLEGLARGLSVGTAALLPVFALALAAAAAGHAVQGGFVFAPRAIEPDWNRLRPWPRLKQLLFSRRALAELLKALLKAAVIAGVVTLCLRRDLPAIVALARESPGGLAWYLSDAAVRLFGLAALGLSGIAAADLVFNRWDLSKRMQMTRQEARDDYKEQEGDPVVRSRRRQRYRALTANRILREVPRADVVVTNPTHLAVALRYQRTRENAPRLTAKGQDALAERIRRLARRHGVPVLENRPLARSLFRKVKVGQPIRPEFFRAVAEIYAALYRRRGEVAP
ncbi:MAG: EscU/YscU/HrcU family type III secretion system export apparatus switch protein [Myxococcales bacterium]|nr:EscU/YscU/HrcU family type III secretion system export apparatus switch protein [Myxococcales bacterium]